jgi:hypothetical protein
LTADATPALPKATAAERRRDALILDIAAMADTLYIDFDQPAQGVWKCPAVPGWPNRRAAVDSPRP